MESDKIKIIWITVGLLKVQREDKLYLRGKVNVQNACICCNGREQNAT